MSRLDSGLPNRRRPVQHHAALHAELEARGTGDNEDRLRAFDGTPLLRLPVLSVDTGQVAASTVAALVERVVYG